MANNLILSQSQRATLQGLVDQYAQQYPANDNVSVSPILQQAYNAINTWIQDALAIDPTSVDSATQLFFRLAVDVNRNALVPASTYIRTATREGLKQTPGRDFGDDAIQRTSNRIALSIFRDLARKGQLPASIDDLIRLDVTGAIVDGGQTWGGWAGALFYMTPRVGPDDGVKGPGSNCSSFESFTEPTI
jgi:hypothetical protein